MRNVINTVIFVLFAISIFTGCSSSQVIIRENSLPAGFKVAVIGATLGGNLNQDLSKRLREGLYGDACLSYGEIDADKCPRKFQDAYSEIRREGFSGEALARIFQLTGADALIFLRVYNFTEKGTSLETWHEKRAGGFQPGGSGKAAAKPMDREEGGKPASSPRPATELSPFEKNGIELMMFEKGNGNPVVLYRTQADRKKFDTVLDRAIREFRYMVLNRSVCSGTANLI